jgi:hypothetical protein
MSVSGVVRTRALPVMAMITLRPPPSEDLNVITVGATTATG